MQDYEYKSAYREGGVRGAMGQGEPHAISSFLFLAQINFPFQE